MPKLILPIPNDYKVPPIYEGDDKAAIALALTLGAQAYDALESEAVAHVRGETHSEAVKQATEALQTTWEQQVAVLKREKRRTEEALDIAKSRLEALDNAFVTQKAQIQKDVRETMQEVLA